MKLLHIDSSVLGPHSVSRQVSAAIVDRLRQATPSLDLVYRDLTQTPLAHLSGSHLAAAQGAPAPAELGPDLAASAAVLNEFLDADIVVIGAPMYNFTIPSQLKAWIDRVLVAGKTFKYDANGPQGLAGNKRVIVAISRGGYYGPGTPAASLEHLETYLRWRVRASWASRAPNSSSPTASRLALSIVRKRWPERFRLPPACRRRKTYADTSRCRTPAAAENSTELKPGALNAKNDGDERNEKPDA